MREAVATWFRQIALVANETQILDPGAVHLDDATLRRLPEAAWRIERMVELGAEWTRAEEVPIAVRAELISTIDGFAADLADIERDLTAVVREGGSSAAGHPPQVWAFPCKSAFRVGARPSPPPGSCVTDARSAKDPARATTVLSSCAGW
jgi:hypothetical protein